MKSLFSVLALLVLTVFSANVVRAQSFDQVLALAKQGRNSEAVSLAMKLADRNDADAQLFVSSAYRNGKQGLPVNRERSVYWLEKAVKNGNPIAMSVLASDLLTGDGVPMDGKRAVALLHRAASLGDAGAMADLGDVYKEGVAAPKNIPAARYWYAQSAAKGNLMGQLGLRVLDLELEEEQRLRRLRADPGGPTTSMCTRVGDQLFCSHQ